MPQIRISFLSLGCRVNQYEIRVLMERLQGKAVFVPFGEPADLTVIDSCVVTKTAERDTRQSVHRARRASPGGDIVLTGCYVDIHPDASREIEPGVFVFSRAEKEAIAAWVEERFSLPPESQPPVPDAGETPWPSSGRPPLVVQNGCSRRCAYCIIPLARGPSVSRPESEVIAELERFFTHPIAEIVISGINLGAWGADLHPPSGFAHLLERMLEATPDGRRLRLGSIEPETIDDGVLQLLAHPKLAPHFHIPLQGAVSEVLRDMRRPLDADAYANLLERVRAHVPDCAVGADVIVGFPTETEAHFEAGLAFVEQCAFSYLHVFPFSPRPGTAAALLPQLPAERVRERAARMRALAERLRDTFLRARAGETEWVAIEKTTPDNSAEGMAGRFFPVRLSPPLTFRRDRLVRVRLVSRDRDGYIGRS